MARIGRLAAFAIFALMGAPLQRVCAGEGSAPVAVGARLSQNENAANLVFDLSRSVDATASALASPDRIVVDMPEVNFQLDPLVGRIGALPNGSVVKGFRFGLLAPGRSRIVIDLARAACPAQVSAKPIVEGEPAARLTIELKPCDPSAFAALVRSSAVSTASASPAVTPAQPVIVLDPGHGGVDGGARGLGGVQEKTLVFSFCAELKRQLDATKRYAIVMTRDGDQYVDLDDRVVMARKANASLFISVHADTLSEDKSVSGSTVYTVADRASDAEAARIAARENASSRASGGERSLGKSGCGRHPVRSQASRDPDLRPHLLARPCRQPARRYEAQPQPGTLGRFRRPQGAGVSLRPGGTRLSFKRHRTSSPLPLRSGGARPPPPWSRPSTRSLPGTESRTAPQPKMASPHQPRRPPPHRRIEACA